MGAFLCGSKLTPFYRCITRYLTPTPNKGTGTRIDEIQHGEVRTDLPAAVADRSSHRDRQVGTVTKSVTKSEMRPKRETHPRTHEPQSPGSRCFILRYSVQMKSVSSWAQRGRAGLFNFFMPQAPGTGAARARINRTQTTAGAHYARVRVGAPMRYNTGHMGNEVPWREKTRQCQ
jgi:hypothetical protein